MRCPICTTKLDFIFILEKDEKTQFSELLKEKDLYYADDDFNVIYTHFLINNNFVIKKQFLSINKILSGKMTIRKRQITFKIMQKI